MFLYKVNDCKISFDDVEFLLHFIVIDSERGEPVTTEEVKYGIRVAVVAMAADPQLKTERALKVVGPKAFGYDFDYTSFTK